jgi:hypothetical protein
MQDEPWLQNWEDYYDILGLDDPGADEKEIKKAYDYKVWTISDVRLVGAPEHVRRKAEEELKNVNRAYDVLKDSGKRKKYHKEWVKRNPKGTPPKPPPDIPKPVVDPEVISFKDVKLGETRKASFVIRNIGGSYTKIWFSNPDSWVKVVHYESVDPNQRDELPIRVYIEAKGNEWGKHYSEFVRVKLDEQETQVRVDLETKPALEPVVPMPPFGEKPVDKIPTWVKISALAIVGIIIVVVLASHFWPTNKATIIPTITPAPISYAVGIHPWGVCFDGTNIWVTNEGSNNVMKLRASDGSLVGTYAVGLAPNSICFDGANIWVGNLGSNTVTKLKASDGSLVGTYGVGRQPNGICFEGAYIWVANHGSNNVMKLNASNGSLLGTYNVGNGPVGVCFDGANIWVANLWSNTVTKLNASNSGLVSTYDVGHGPTFICFDGANIWVGNSGSNNVMKLNASDGSLLGTYNVGTSPYGVCFDGANIWVANYGSNTVTKLRASDGSLVGTYVVGTNPECICFDGANIWVANYGSNTVTKR